MEPTREFSQLGNIERFDPETGAWEKFGAVLTLSMGKDVIEALFEEEAEGIVYRMTETKYYIFEK